MSKQNNRLALKIIVFAGKLFLLFKKYSIIVLKEVILVNFKEVLNKYLKELDCSSKKLSNPASKPVATAAEIIVPAPSSICWRHRRAVADCWRS